MSKSRRSGERESFWRLALDEQRKSGLSVREFCLQKGVSTASYYAWKRKLDGRSSEESDGGAGAAKLIPVEIVSSIAKSPDDAAADAEQLELVTPSVYTLRFPPTLAPQQLGAVLAAVAQSSGASPC